MQFISFTQVEYFFFFLLVNQTLKGQHLVPQMYCLLSNSHTTNTTASSQFQEIDPLCSCFPGVCSYHVEFPTVSGVVINMSEKCFKKYSCFAACILLSSRWQSNVRCVCVFHQLKCTSTIIMFLKKNKKKERFRSYTTNLWVDKQTTYVKAIN